MAPRTRTGGPRSPADCGGSIPRPGGNPKAISAAQAPVLGSEKGERETVPGAGLVRRAARVPGQGFAYETPSTPTATPRGGCSYQPPRSRGEKTEAQREVRRPARRPPPLGPCQPRFGGRRSQAGAQAPTWARKQAKDSLQVRGQLEVRGGAGPSRGGTQKDRESLGGLPPAQLPGGSSRFPTASPPAGARRETSLPGHCEPAVPTLTSAGPGPSEGLLQAPTSGLSVSRARGPPRRASGSPGAGWGAGNPLPAAAGPSQGPSEQRSRGAGGPAAGVLSHRPPRWAEVHRK